MSLSLRRLREMQPGLDLLLAADECAKDLKQDTWNFAVELSLLAEHGLTIPIVRWLLASGYVHHRVECTPPGEQQREFHSWISPQFCKQSCLVLSDQGLGFATQVCSAYDEASLADPSESSAKSSAAKIPHWDPDRRELYWGSELIKRFRVPAANQELILNAFQKQGWPSHIDDPLPRLTKGDSKKRLHNVINNLNKHRLATRLAFRGNGNGHGVAWEAT